MEENIINNGTDSMTKNCPYCGKEIPATDEKCKYCGELLYSDSIKGFFKFSFVDVFIRHYADFKGKISRKQFWLGYLSYALLMLALWLIDFLIGTSFVFVLIGSLFLIVPGLAFVVRRLHDINKSGWWIFISFVPVIGYIWLFVLLIKKGETKSPKVRLGVIDWVAFALIAILVVSSIFSFRKMLSDMSYGSDLYSEEFYSDNMDTDEFSFTKYYEGVFDGKYYCDIELSFTPSSENSSIYWIGGSASYENANPDDTYLLIGSYDSDSSVLDLTEYLNDTDNIIGRIYAVKTENGEFAGSIYYPENIKEMSFYMKEK